MEENYKLEKEYKVPFDTFREAYRAFQKKFIYPKSYIFMAIFLILAADFVWAAVKAPSNTLAYVLIVVCLAFAFREWYNPRKIRNNLVDAVRELGEPVYRIGIAEDHVDISTVEAPDVEKDEPSGDDDTELPEDFDPLPEKTRLAIDEDFRVYEYDRFFLLFSGKKMFYILPKEGFSAEELEIVRKMEKK